MPRVAAMSLVQKLKSWSFSRFDEYHVPNSGCPAKVRYKHIEKIKTGKPMGEALIRGNAVHAMAEAYIKSEKTYTYEINAERERRTAPMPRGCPGDLKKFEHLFADLRKKYTKKSALLPMTVEGTWAFRSDWSITRFNDWNECWLRYKADCGDFEYEDSYVVRDWKTGRLRPEKNAAYLQQVELGALCAAIVHARKGLQVRAELIYLDEGEIVPGTIITMEDVPKLKKKWEKLVKAMMNDTTFAPVPSPAACRFCDFKKADGGPCRF